MQQHSLVAVELLDSRESLQFDLLGHMHNFEYLFAGIVLRLHHSHYAILLSFQDSAITLK